MQESKYDIGQTVYMVQLKDGTPTPVEHVISKVVGATTDEVTVWAYITTDNRRIYEGMVYPSREAAQDAIRELAEGEVIASCLLFAESSLAELITVRNSSQTIQKVIEATETYRATIQGLYEKWLQQLENT